MLKKFLKILAWVLGIGLSVLLVLIVYVRVVAKIDPPSPKSRAILDETVVQVDTGLFVLGNNWFRKSESGLYELYVEGEPFERG